MGRNLYCTVVEVPVVSSRGRRMGSARDLLPWADPYIAGLICKLQAEVRAERAESGNTTWLRGASSLQSEATPPNGDGRLDFDVADYEAWPRREEPRREDMPNGRF